MQSNDTIEYCYSFDEEIYRGRYSSAEEALAEAKDMREAGEHPTVWIGQCKEVQVESLIYADNVIDAIQQAAYERVGESSEDWLFVNAEQKKELEQLILGWVMRNDAPTFYEVTEATPHTLATGDAA